MAMNGVKKGVNVKIIYYLCVDKCVNIEQDYEDSAADYRDF